MSLAVVGPKATNEVQYNFGFSHRSHKPQFSEVTNFFTDFSGQTIGISTNLLLVCCATQLDWVTLYCKNPIFSINLVHHFSLHSFTTSAIDLCCNLRLLSSFLIQSSLVTPAVFLNTLISDACSLVSSLSLLAPTHNRTSSLALLLHCTLLPSLFYSTPCFQTLFLFLLDLLTSDCDGVIGYSSF